MPPASQSQPTRIISAVGCWCVRKDVICRGVRVRGGMAEHMVQALLFAFPFFDLRCTVVLEVTCKLVIDEGSKAFCIIR